MAGGRTFLDTNVLVYAIDEDEPVKRRRAREVMAAERWVISTQVLNEFYSVATRKLSRPLSEAEAAGLVDGFCTFPTVLTDVTLVKAAIASSRSAQISIWDALIVEAAATAGCERVLTEDLADGASVRGVRIENPFADAA